MKLNADQLNLSLLNVFTLISSQLLNGQKIEYIVCSVQ